MSFIDPTRAPRKGEELDLRIVGDYLKKNIPGLSGDLTVEQFPSGYSNLTYLLRMGDQELVLRRPPFGAKRIKAGHDMHREYVILAALQKVYPPAPKPLAYCDDESVMGASFYVMERKKGIILRKDPPAGLVISPKTARKLGVSFLDNLTAIHSIDYKAIGLGEMGKPEGFLDRQVNGWSERYGNAKTDEIPEVEPLINLFKKNIPKSGTPTLIHNDYKFDNLVLDPNDLTHIVGVLDWEMSTIGDPMLDLGVTLSYWVQRDDPDDLHLTRTIASNLEGLYTRQEIVDNYAKKTGRDISQMPFYYSFGLFKLAVIVQQIYYRFAKGFTKDERFGMLLAAVRIQMKYALKVIETQKLDFA